MTRRNRLKQLEQENARRESPKRRYLRFLLAYIEKATAARLSGDEAQQAEVKVMRQRLEELAREAW